MKMEKISIELSPEEAQAFIAFRKHQDTFQSLLNAGVFNIHNGHATINFNSEGVISEIQLQLIGYSRGKPIVQDIVLR